MTRIRFDTLSDTLGFQLRRASALLKAGIEAELEPLGLRTSEATVLLALGENPGRTQSELGRDLRVKPANMVPTVGRLAAAGLIARTPGPRRAIALHLTDAGTARLQDVREALQRHEDRIARQLTPEDKARLVAALRAIADQGCRDEHG
jgi:DNA-binding MarR family transcriptional regulator